MNIWLSYIPSAIDGPSYISMVCYCGESGQGIKCTEVISYHIAFLIYPPFDVMICTYRILIRCDYVTASKLLPHFWFFVRGIHWWSVDSPHKGQVMFRMDVFLIVRLDKLLNKNNSVGSEMRCFSISTHLPLKPHICVSELCQHWFR